MHPCLKNIQPGDIITYREPGATGLTGEFCVIEDSEGQLCMLGLTYRWKDTTFSLNCFLYATKEELIKIVKANR